MAERRADPYRDLDVIEAIELPREDLEPDVDDARRPGQGPAHHLGAAMPYALIFR